MPKAACQPDEHGICEQCGERVAFAMVTCKAARPLPPAAATPAKEPNIIAKVASMCMAVGTWKSAGSPTRTRAKIAELLNTCRGCEQLIDQETTRQRCAACGCPINDWLDAHANKLAMATESCPLKEPRWKAEEM